MTLKINPKEHLIFIDDDVYEITDINSEICQGVALSENPSIQKFYYDTKKSLLAIITPGKEDITYMYMSAVMKLCNTSKMYQTRKELRGVNVSITGTTKEDVIEGGIER